MNLADVKEEQSEDENDLEIVARPESTPSVSDMINNQHPRGSSAGTSNNLAEDQELEDM
jgi:hypothetical protein